MFEMTERPKYFFTLDLRRVLRHLATGGSYATIPPPPVVPDIEITTPSANMKSRKQEKEARDRRMEAFNMDFVNS